MKKIVDRSQYPEQLGFLPNILEPLMNAVKDKLHASVPIGWVPLRLEEETPTDVRYRSTVAVITTLYVVRAPRFVYNRYLRLKKSTRNLVQ
jgi:hypothetical protein